MNRSTSGVEEQRGIGMPGSDTATNQAHNNARRATNAWLRDKPNEATHKSCPHLSNSKQRDAPLLAVSVWKSSDSVSCTSTASSWNSAFELLLDVETACEARITRFSQRARSKRALVAERVQIPRATAAAAHTSRHRLGSNPTRTPARDSDPMRTAQIFKHLR